MSRLRIPFAVVAVCAVLVVSVGAGLAAEPADVASDVRDDGIYLDPGVDLSLADASELVGAARNAGSRFHLVVLAEEPVGGSVAFSDAVFDRLGVSSGSVVTLTPESVGWATQNDVFFDSDFDRALEAANDAGGDDTRYLSAFVEALTGSPVSTSSGAGSGGGGSGLVWFLVILVLIGGGLWWVMRRSRKSKEAAAAARLEAARGKVQEQIDAVANDVLDLAEEVRLADNAEADRYYEAASETYARVSDEFPAATQPAQLIAISEQLDQAIWELDAAEAVLDGKPVPPKPVVATMEPEPEPAPSAAPSAGSYERRPSRRSSYVGPGLMDILVGVGSVIASSRGSRPRSRSGGGLLGGGGLFGSSPRNRSGSGGLFGGRGSSSSRVRAPRSGSPRSTRSSRPRSSGRSRGGGKRRR